ncbi:S8 family serine peptidase [[Empedobacter] haloabium]|uniref:S8 family serine peptidase n=1 Tax=[Empedobacter] haloabium TaxID=592317 RepID=A0ABZ1UEQ7_9BURK
MSDNPKDQQKPRRSEAASADAADASAGRSEATVPVSDDGRGTTGERHVQYLVTLRRRPALALTGLSGLPALGQPDMDRVHNLLRTMRNVTVVRRVQSNRLALMGNGPASGSHDIIVVRTSPGAVGALSALAHPGLIVERDHLLGHLADTGPRLSPTIGLRPLNVIPASTTLRFQVRDTREAPQQNCAVVLYTNGGAEAQGMTDAQGRASIAVPVGYVNDIAAIYVKPFADCWEWFRYRPVLSVDDINPVQLQRLPEFSGAGFAAPTAGSDGFAGWGARLMGLTEAARGAARGRGIKVAIIDSGCDNTHPALTHVTIGQDYTNLDGDQRPDSSSWVTDTMSHGTHCAGVITGNGRDGHIRGFVPDAEVHVLKLFPGGAFNNLAAALHYCIDNQIDVVNCSLGGDQTSEAIAQLVDEARQAGVAVVVAAGNSSGPVQFPASVPGVMCVAAIGATGAFPDTTYHAQTCAQGSAGPNGLFAATFSCRGPQVGVCAPGVAVISSVPGGGYAAWDGTSMATPAVTGLVALVMGSHPEFMGPNALRGTARVDRAFQLIAAAAAPLPIPRQQAGAGLPRVTAGAPATAAAFDAMSGWNGGANDHVSQAQLEELVRAALVSGLAALQPAGARRM